MNGIVRDLFDAIIDAFDTPKGFNAEFGKESSIASRWNKGFLISKHRRLSVRKSQENLLLVGPTGSGKTTKILLKNLYRLKNCSMVVNDPSGELFALSSGYLSQYFTIKTINFSDSSNSSGYNIFSRVKKPNDVHKIIHILVETTLNKGGSSDPFWSLASTNFLTTLLRLLLHQAEAFRNMPNLIQLVNYFAAEPKKIDTMIAATGDEKLILDYKSLLATPEKTLQNIVASAKTAIQLFDDPEIARTVSYDSINFDELRQKPTVIFLRNSISEQSYINVLNSIFFEQLYGHILQRLPRKDELNVYIILEECSSMLIKLLPLALANCRKHRTATLCCVQSPAQLKAFYRDQAENITNNCVSKLFLPGLTAMDTLKEIESLSGKCIYKDEKGTERVKPLITVEEIRLLPDNRTIILSGNQPIIKGRTSYHYRSFRYKRYAAIPPVELPGDIPDGPIPLLK
jgi:type IV secretory pathway TraG/TraD family ATPase VirD4